MLALVLAGMAGCDPPPSGEPPDDEEPASIEPAWLVMRPNYRQEESARLQVEAIEACDARFPLDSLRADLDSVRGALGIEPARTRSHPEAARRLDLLLERQELRRECIDTSPGYVRSREIVQDAPDEYVLPLHAEADSASTRSGTIRIVREADAMGPPRLTFAYRSAGGADTTEATWTTDRQQVDGYGEYVHTVIDRQGDWLLLPADPFPTPVWIDWRGTFRSAPEVWPIFGDVYSMRPAEAEAAGLVGPLSPESPGVVYLRREGDRLWFRLEGPGDGPCPELAPAPPTPDASEGDAPVADGGEYSIGVDEILDGRGHLALRVKYARGC